MKKFVLMFLAATGMLVAAASSSFANAVVARIDVSSQTMTVSKHGRVLYTWPVSTARKGYVTPRGQYRPTRMHKMWYSRKYDMSPMPYSIFFRGGYAIHGTNYVKQLGRPASHGCVRLHTANAARLYALVKEVGAGNARIVVTN
jgi:lipoprotein-anchoring transpeptidase ErfK/SrfK